MKVLYAFFAHHSVKYSVSLIMISNYEIALNHGFLNPVKFFYSTHL